MEARDTRAITVLHYYSTGPGQEWHAWLLANGARESVLLEHPFPFSHRTAARVERCGADVEPTSVLLPRTVRWAPLRYALDVLRTLRVALQLPGQYDVYVGCGCVNAAPGVLLRWLGKVRRVIMYTIDYVPDAHGAWIAPLYRGLDRWCCYHCDTVWNLTQTRMTAARVANGLDRRRAAPQIWVPHGTHAEHHAAHAPPAEARYRIAFFGHVKESSGVQLFLEVMPALRAEYPALTLDIIGDGPYLDTLRQMVAEKGLEPAVRFHGFIEDHATAEAVLRSCGIGVALYRRGPGDYSEFTDPGKPKVYMGCGLPVIIGNVPELAAHIERRGAGVAVNYTAAEVRRAVRQILANYHTYRENALAMAHELTWQRVFARAWAETFDGREHTSRT